MQKLHVVFFSSILVAAVGMTGCGGGAGSPGVNSASALSGSVYGGSQPISGASVQLWAAGSLETDTTPTPTALSAVTLTKSDGTFSLNNAYTCPTSDPEVYVVARGGDAGGGTNPAIALISALSDCNSLTSSTHILVNEATTVVAVNVLNNYMNISGGIGLNSYNPIVQEMAFQFFTDSGYINPANGTEPGPNAVDAGIVGVSYVPALNTLADLLAACLDSPVSGGTSSECTQIFQNAATLGYSESLLDGDTLSPGFVPSDTIQLAIVMASGYEANATASQQQYGQISAQSPFQPIDTSVPPASWGFVPGGVLMAAITLTNDGVVHLTETGQTAFVVEVNTEGALSTTEGVELAINLPDTVPVGWEICQTDSNTGQCITTPAPFGNVVAATPGSILTFAVFMEAYSPLPTNITAPILFEGPQGGLLGSTTVTLTTN